MMIPVDDHKTVAVNAMMYPRDCDLRGMLSPWENDNLFVKQVVVSRFSPIVWEFLNLVERFGIFDGRIGFGALKAVDGKYYPPTHVL